MKIRIKSTGEIKKVADYATVTLDTCDSYGDPEQVSFDDIELISDVGIKTLYLQQGIDWKQTRVNAAIAAMQGLCNSCHDSVIREIQEQSDKERSNVISYLSVRMADALVYELNKNEEKTLRL